MSYVVIHGKLHKVRRDSWTGKTNEPDILASANEEKRRAELKGKDGGNCNVTACQKPGATWWNISTRAYYCPRCADEINRWSRHDEGFDICFPSRSVAEAEGHVW